MGRTNTVKNHPQIHRIDTMLDDGVPYSAIAREVGVAVSTLGRYAILRKSELARIVDDEPGVTEVLSRLVQVADHARDVRRQVKLAGSPVAQSRAIKGEAEILARLITELGIDDLRVSMFMDEAQAMLTAMRVFLRTYPESAADLLKTFSDVPELADLTKALRSAGIGTTA